MTLKCKNKFFLDCEEEERVNIPSSNENENVNDESCHKNEDDKTGSDISETKVNITENDEIDIEKKANDLINIDTCDTVFKVF